MSEFVVSKNEGHFVYYSRPQAKIEQEDYLLLSCVGFCSLFWADNILAHSSLGWK